MKKLAAFLCSLQVIILLALVSCSSPLRNQSGSIVIDTTIPDDEVSRTSILLKILQRILSNFCVILKKM